jgi:hypothetical protein
MVPLVEPLRLCYVVLSRPSWWGHMARKYLARRLKGPRWEGKKSERAQLKVRLPEPLRFSLEKEAASRGHSMNTEIVRRLSESFLARDQATTIIAKTLLEGLDDYIVNEMVDTVNRQRAEDDLANEMLDDPDYRESLK